MKTLTIEWKHFAQNGETCCRCCTTGETLIQVVAEMRNACSSQGIDINFMETVLGPERISESNTILFNGVPLEEVLDGATISKDYCGSCSELAGRESYCRTVERNGETYQEIPASLIREAACKAIDCDCEPNCCAASRS